MSRRHLATTTAVAAATVCGLVLAAPSAAARDDRPLVGSPACVHRVENSSTVIAARQRLAADQTALGGQSTLLAQLRVAVTGTATSTITDPLSVAVGVFAGGTSKAGDITTQTGTVAAARRQVEIDRNDLRIAIRNATSALCRPADAPTSSSPAPSTTTSSPSSTTVTSSSPAPATTTVTPLAVNPTQDDGSTATTNGSEVRDVPAGSAQTGAA